MDKKYYFYIVIIAAIIASFVLDSKIVNLFASNRLEILNIMFILFSNYYLLYLIILVICILLYKHKNKIIIFLLSSLSTYLIVGFMKFIIKRSRPEVISLVAVNTYSFPSMHAAIAFMPLAVISKEFPRFKIYYIIIASLISFSRLYNGVHFISDIIVGALIGYIIGLGLLRLEEKYNCLNNFFIKLKNI